MNPTIISEKISYIRAIFNIGTKDISKLLKVKKQEIFQWLKNEPSKNKQIERNVITLYNIAKRWHELSNGNAQNILFQRYKGETLLKILENQIIDENEVLELFQKVSMSPPKTKGLGLKEFAEKHNFDYDKVTENNCYPDVLMGKPNIPNF